MGRGVLSVGRDSYNEELFGVDLKFGYLVLALRECYIRNSRPSYYHTASHPICMVTYIGADCVGKFANLSGQILVDCSKTRFKLQSNVFSINYQGQQDSMLLFQAIIPCLFQSHRQNIKIHLLIFLRTYNPRHPLHHARLNSLQMQTQKP